jgi:hypothetical protein
MPLCVNSDAVLLSTESLSTGFATLFSKSQNSVSKTQRSPPLKTIPSASILAQEIVAESVVYKFSIFAFFWIIVIPLCSGLSTLEFPTENKTNPTASMKASDIS